MRCLHPECRFIASVRRDLLPPGSGWHDVNIVRSSSKAGQYRAAGVFGGSYSMGETINVQNFWICFRKFNIGPECDLENCQYWQVLWPNKGLGSILFEPVSKNGHSGSWLCQLNPWGCNNFNFGKRRLPFRWLVWNEMFGPIWLHNMTTLQSWPVIQFRHTGWLEKCIYWTVYAFKLSTQFLPGRFNVSSFWRRYTVTCVV